MLWFLHVNRVMGLIINFLHVLQVQFRLKQVVSAPVETREVCFISDES